MQRYAGHRVQPRIDARADRPGVTGFLVDSVDETVDAIGRIAMQSTVKRPDTAARQVARSISPADRYLEVYRSLLGLD